MVRIHSPLDTFKSERPTLKMVVDMGDNSERRVFYFKNMRKLIDLNEETFKTLSKLAIDNNTNLKSYIESILVTHAGGGF